MESRILVLRFFLSLCHCWAQSSRGLIGPEFLNFFSEVTIHARILTLILSDYCHFTCSSKQNSLLEKRINHHVNLLTCDDKKPLANMVLVEEYRSVGCRGTTAFNPIPYKMGGLSFSRSEIEKKWHFCRRISRRLID